MIRSFEPRQNATRRRPSEVELERRSSWNWLLLSGTALAATTGLAAALMPLLELYVKPVWPWEHTQFLLPAALALSFVALSVYVTDQQRHVGRLRKELSERVATHN